MKARSKLMLMTLREALNVLTREEVMEILDVSERTITNMLRGELSPTYRMKTKFAELSHEAGVMIEEWNEMSGLRLDAEPVRRILARAREMMPVREICEELEITPPTFYSWESGRVAPFVKEKPCLNKLQRKIGSDIEWKRDVNWLPRDLVMLTLKQAFRVNYDKTFAIFGETEELLERWRWGHEDAPYDRLMKFRRVARKFCSEALQQEWRAVRV